MAEVFPPMTVRQVEDKAREILPFRVDEVSKPYMLSSLRRLSTLHNSLAPSCILEVAYGFLKRLVEPSRQ